MFDVAVFSCLPCGRCCVIYAIIIIAIIILLLVIFTQQDANNKNKNECRQPELRM
jgi:cytochrome c oxidase subunit IV